MALPTQNRVWLGTPEWDLNVTGQPGVATIQKLPTEGKPAGKVIDLESYDKGGGVWGVRMPAMTVVGHYRVVVDDMTMVVVCVPKFADTPEG